MSARHIVGIGDLTDEEITDVLERAASFADGAAPPRADKLIGLGFFEASLRTRVGFASAAHRSGASVVEVNDRRAAVDSMPESLIDTVRTVSGYIDALIVRAPRPAGEVAAAVLSDVPFLNAGDRGPGAEHPSQALIDFFAIERMVGPIDSVHVAICGDLRMRSARSLLALLARRPPASLSLITDESLLAGFALPAALVELTSFTTLERLGSVSVLNAVGIPHGAATEGVRSTLRIDGRALSAMSATGIVLSPMPIIDEIASSARSDPRMRYFEQSDLALSIRMALLDLLLRRGR